MADEEAQENAEAPEKPSQEDLASTRLARLRGIGKYIAGAVATILQPLYFTYKMIKATVYEGLYQRNWPGAAKDYAEGFGSNIFWPYYWLWKGAEGSYNLYEGKSLPWD